MTFSTRPHTVKWAANLATGLLALFIVIQLLTAAGTLPISILWGGRQSELTPGLRAAGLGATALLALFITIIRVRAGLTRRRAPASLMRVLAWGVTAYLALNTIGNFASVNLTEKFLFGPLTLVLALACYIVAASGKQATA